MVSYNITISDPALSDLEGIYRYFAGQLLMTTASKTVKNIEAEINDNLSFMPYYPLVNNDFLALMGIRRMVVKKYLIFFIINEEDSSVNVIHVIHGARDWERILLEEM